jgi:translation initiation factor 2 beta subunit (eIF-2beta)/eIF-5
MKAFNLLIITICIILFAISGWLWNKVSHLEQTLTTQNEPGLYEVMTQMQTIIHKLTYAVEYENEALVDFYIHELEEATEEIVDAGMIYHGEAIGQLTENMLEPVIEDLEDALETGDWNLVRDRKSVVIQACNTCHEVTGYGSIIITDKAEINPFNQDFTNQD